MQKSVLKTLLLSVGAIAVLGLTQFILQAEKSHQRESVGAKSRAVTVATAGTCSNQVSDLPVKKGPSSMHFLFERKKST